VARPLAALLALAVIGITGCTLQPTGTATSATVRHKAPAHRHKPAAHRHESRAARDQRARRQKAARHRAATRHPAPADTLITEPGAGFSPVYRLINDARHSIDLTMYEFADTRAEAELAAAARRGVAVRVILDQREQSENRAAYRYLTGHRVKVAWSSSRFTYTHQKTLVTDDSTAIIMTANLTSTYYPTSRDFLVVDKARADVSAVVAVFNADFRHVAITPGAGQDLVWSPTNSQARLLALINGARKSLRIYSEEMGDSTVIDALISAARRGVNVQICGENSGGEYDSAFTRLARAGVHISYFSSPSGFYIHGKVIEADYGTGDARVFIGSENFSSTSLNRNRELGLITSEPAILTAIASTFAADFGRGRHW
jgi:phosphatidylserine/phosphatidylglycerophosphate/cardiolipin synthase-like enzyme